MPSKLTKYAKIMRKNPTVAEKKLWNSLRSKQMKGLKFRRQQPIDDIIADFVNFEKRIVIEVDGGQHATQTEQDSKRDKELEEKGYKVLRFWNNDVIKNTDEVLERIRKECLGMNDGTPSPHARHREPLRRGGRVGPLPSREGRYLDCDE